MAKYVITKKAVEDLSSIWNYTVEMWSERQADDYYEMLISSFSKIARYPNLFGIAYDEIYKGLKGFKANKHIIFYRVLPNFDVEIIRILHERMDFYSKFRGHFPRATESKKQTHSASRQSGRDARP